MNKHQNPDGTYNGVAVMSEVSGLPQSEIKSIWEEVKANQSKLDSCPYHELEELVTAPPGKGRYRCKQCSGEVDGSAYRWHERGRRQRPQTVSELPVLPDTLLV